MIPSYDLTSLWRHCQARLTGSIRSKDRRNQSSGKPFHPQFCRFSFDPLPQNDDSCLIVNTQVVDFRLEEKCAKRREEGIQEGRKFDGGRRAETEQSSPQRLSNFRLRLGPPYLRFLRRDPITIQVFQPNKSVLRWQEDNITIKLCTERNEMYAGSKESPIGD